MCDIGCLVVRLGKREKGIKNGSEAARIREGHHGKSSFDGKSGRGLFPWCPCLQLVMSPYKRVKERQIKLSVYDDLLALPEHNRDHTSKSTL